MSGRALPPRVRRSDLVLADLLNDPTVLGVLGGPPADAAAIVARVLADPTVMRDSRRLLTEPKAARDLLISAVDEVVDVLADGAGPAAVHHLLVEPDRHVATAAGFVLLSSFATSGGVPIVVSLTATVTRGPDGNPAVAGVALDDYVGRDVHQRLVDDVTALAAATGFVPERPCARVALIIGRGFGAQRHEVIATAAVEGVAIEVFANVDPDNPDSLEAVRRRVAGACSGVVTWTGKSDQWAMRLATDAERQGKLRFAIYGDDQVALQMRSVARKLLVAGEARQAAPVAPPSRKLTLCLKKTGSRGTSDVLEPAEPCNHNAKSKSRRGAEAKWKGAQEVSDLPPGAVLRRLVVCGRPDCNVAWATYRLPATEGDPS